MRLYYYVVTFHEYSAPATMEVCASTHTPKAVQKAIARQASELEPYTLDYVFSSPPAYKWSAVVGDLPLKVLHLIEEEAFEGNP